MFLINLQSDFMDSQLYLDPYMCLFKLKE